MLVLNIGVCHQMFSFIFMFVILWLSLHTNVMFNFPSFKYFIKLVSNKWVSAKPFFHLLIHLLVANKDNYFLILEEYHLLY